MDIRLSKESEVPLRQQLAEQVVFLIATKMLLPGDVLPSVRQLARRLKIHHNTVSEAYQDLVRRTWLVRRRGSRLVVHGPAGSSARGGRQSLDDLINDTIRLSREQGHSLQALRQRVRERLLAEPPDHVLVVEEEPGLCRVLIEEIKSAVAFPVEGCSRGDLAANPGLAIGALPAAAQYCIAAVDPLVPKDRPAVPLTFAAADQHLHSIRRLQQPSVIAVVSVSKAFLRTARSLLAPALGRRHVLREVLLPLDDPKALRAADLVFVDSIARGRVRHPRAVHYQLIATSSLEYLAGAMKSYQSASNELS